MSTVGSIKGAAILYSYVILYYIESCKNAAIMFQILCCFISVPSYYFWNMSNSQFEFQQEKVKLFFEVTATTDVHYSQDGIMKFRNKAL